MVGRALLACAIFLIVLGAILFTAADTLMYTLGWIVLSLMAFGVIGATLYVACVDPQLLRRRLAGGPAYEQRTNQRLIQSLNGTLFILLFVISGFDHRFHWSSNNVMQVIVGDALIVVGFYVVYLAFRQNSYAGATIGVESSQALCSSGLYAHVRHPMYAGALLLLSGLPLALGSWIALCIVPLLIAGVVLRLRDEEQLLADRLPGYAQYCERVPYRLLPWLF